MTYHRRFARRDSGRWLREHSVAALVEHVRCMACHAAALDRRTVKSRVGDQSAPGGGAVGWSTTEHSDMSNSAMACSGVSPLAWSSTCNRERAHTVKTILLNPPSLSRGMENSNAHLDLAVLVMPGPVLAVLQCVHLPALHRHPSVSTRARRRQVTLRNGQGQRKGIAGGRTFGGETARHRTRTRRPAAFEVLQG
jgi:hypothetical protein